MEKKANEFYTVAATNGKDVSRFTKEKLSGSDLKKKSEKVSSSLMMALQLGRQTAMSEYLAEHWRRKDKTSVDGEMLDFFRFMARTNIVHFLYCAWYCDFHLASHTVFIRL